MIWTSLNENKRGKKRPIKNTWYDGLINDIPEPIRKTVSRFKDRVFLRQTHQKIMVKTKSVRERKETK